jgi:endoglucanase
VRHEPHLLMKTLLFTVGVLALVALLHSARAAPLASSPAPLTVSAGQLMADSKPVHLRGIDWGWWHLAHTKYTEADMSRQAQWGANMARLSFTYTDLEDPAHPGTINEALVKNVDEVVSWAAKYHQYLILNEHVAPGGQDPALYCDGGHNNFWKDTRNQDRFIALWTEIARRYRDQPAVAAYELMNEPCTQQAVPDKLVEVCRRTVKAIRAVDPNKVIVMPGDQWSGAEQLVDAVKLDDPNVLYTFHFYKGMPSEEWISNAPEGEKLSGSQDWSSFDSQITIPRGVSSLSLLLRSEQNTGTAWFDDVQLTDNAGHQLLSSAFDEAPTPFKRERDAAGDIAFDSAFGHSKASSLRVARTDSYNGWVSQARIRVWPGQTYHLKGWIKLSNATGRTYLSAAYWGIKSNTVDKEQMRHLLAPAVAFRRKYHVPVWVGEFGCEKAVPTGLQSTWVSTCIELFEESGFNWSYWNYKEDSGPDGMALMPEHHDGSDYPVNDDLLAALQHGWAEGRLN